MRDYIITRDENTDELQHYGALGMKWGVRRNTRVLENHRRNSAVRDIKKDYKSGKITRSEKKAAIQSANVNKKNAIRQSKYMLKNFKNRQDARDYRKNIASQTIAEVPHRHLKKGATTVNHLLAGINTAGAGIGALVGATAATAVAPGLGTLFIGSAAVSGAAALGAHALVQMGIDKLS